MRRDNAATTDGLASLRYGSVDVQIDSCHVALQVAANLQLRGWAGPLRRCGRCRLVA